MQLWQAQTTGPEEVAASNVVEVEGFLRITPPLAYTSSIN